jgi:Cu-Zn family superoxide dismutase
MLSENQVRGRSVMRNAFWLSGGFVALLGAVGCDEPVVKGEGRAGGAKQVAEASRPEPVQVDLRPASGSTVKGHATLTEQANGVSVFVEFASAPPGKHGLHVHERGDCSDPRAESAGEHFSPERTKHGLPTDPEHHLGDLGNVTIDEEGGGYAQRAIPTATLRKHVPRSLIGRSLVLSEPEDRGSGHPAEVSGRRIACGVISR